MTRLRESTRELSPCSDRDDMTVMTGKWYLVGGNSVSRNTSEDTTISAGSRPNSQLSDNSFNAHGFFFFLIMLTT